MTWFHAGRLDRSTEIQVVTYVNYESHPSEHRSAHALGRLTHSSPFDVVALSLGVEWKGSVDKLFAYAEYVDRVCREQSEKQLLLLLDAFDIVFSPHASADSVLATYRAFGKEVVIATEENAYPVEVEDDAEWLATNVFHLVPRIRYPSRYVNVGGILGTATGLREIFAGVLHNLRTKQDAQDIMDKADHLGHWFLHAFDQFKIFLYLLKHNQSIASWVALDAEQKLFGSTLLRRGNRPALVPLLNGTERAASIDIKQGVEFNAPLAAFRFEGCVARWLDRMDAPLLWHGHGPEKGAYIRLLEEYDRRGCYQGR